MVKIRRLSPELEEVAVVQLGEDPNKIAQMLPIFRTWVERHPYLRARNDDQFLIAFLRFCRYDLDAAKIRIEYYYNYKTTIAPELWQSRRINDKLLSICRSGIFATLPKPAGTDGPRIHVTTMGKIDTSLFNVTDLFRYHLFRSEIEINTDDNWVISGVLEIVDMKKLPYSILRQYESKLFRKMAAALEYGIPTTLKGTHIVNASREAQLVLMLVRTVMKEKQLLHIHSSIESLRNAIGKEYLPEEYGGDNGTIDGALEGFITTLQGFQDYFNEEENYGIDEQARLACPDKCPELPKEDFS